MKTLMFFFALFFASTALAVDGVYLGDPAYNGTGCPMGSAAASLSPDATSLSILFSEFNVEAGRTVPGAPRVARKTCNISIPVHVPQGWSVSVFQIDYRGFNSLPAGASSQFDVEYFFAGSRGPRYTKRFLGELTDNYLLRNTLTATAIVWSACGADVNLRTNTSMMVSTNRRLEQAMATVDTMDVEAGLIYLLQWRRC